MMQSIVSYLPICLFFSINNIFFSINIIIIVIYYWEVFFEYYYYSQHANHNY